MVDTVGRLQGLEAGMHKQILYTGLRLGLYDHLTSSTVEGGVSIPEKIAYAGASFSSLISPERRCYEAAVIPVDALSGHATGNRHKFSCFIPPQATHSSEPVVFTRHLSLVLSCNKCVLAGHTQPMQP